MRISTKFSLPLLALMAAVANADTIVDRGLPYGNTVNEVAGINRSNIDWAQPATAPDPVPFLLGDNFTVPNGSSGYNIAAITVFMTTFAGAAPTDVFSDFTLYGGLDSNPAAFGIIPTLSITFDRAYYPGAGDGGDPCNTGSGAEYQFSSGCKSIYAVTFNVNFVLSAGDIYNFGVSATPLTGQCDTDNINNCLFLHASNAALSGTPQDGADGAFLSWDPLDLSSSYLSYDASNSGWNKGSDINVVVQGSPVPEPSTYGMMLIGAGLIAWRQRSRRA